MFNMKSKVFFLLILTVFLVGCVSSGDVATEETAIEETLDGTEIEEIPEESIQPQTIENAEIITTLGAGEFQLIVIRDIEHTIGISSIFFDTASISVDGQEIEMDVGGEETVNGLQVSLTDILISSKETVSDKAELIVKAVE